MDDPRRGERSAIPAPGTAAQRLRIATGLVLFAFLSSHLGNHALGLVDLELMQQVQDIRLSITRSLPGQAILILSALVHLVLGTAKFLRRRTLRIGFAELLQLAFGLLIPLLLLRHILGTRGVFELFGIRDDYHRVLWAMWPDEWLTQAILITLAWTHGALGIFHWLRLRPWFVRMKTPIIALAVLWPVLGYAGFIAGGRIVQLETSPPSALDAGQLDLLKWATAIALWTYAALLASLMLYRVGRAAMERLQPGLQVSYAGGPTVKVPAGYSLLEISRQHGIPHASICGGRARCSTCRVRVIEGLDAQPAPEPAERKVLERIGASAPVRLACQLRPVSDLTVATLLPAGREWAAAPLSFDRYYWGVEEHVTILFGDLRGFTALSEKRLPFDVVFMLNQYLGRMAEVIQDAGGQIDKFIGDGVMAIFGMGKPPAEGARMALAAAKGMGGMLDSLNHSLVHDLKEPLEIAIGVESGNAILGRIGLAGQGQGAHQITALGDTVNTASRLEEACRLESVQCLISLRTLEAAGLDPGDHSRVRLTVKGKVAAVEAIAFRRAVAIPLDWTRIAAP